VLTLESASGNTVMCVRAGADSLLGLPGIIGNEPYTMTAMARKGSEVRVVTRADFEDVIRMEPSLGLLVLQVLAVEVRSVRQALSEV
jgi:CRP-like cAMP-binding protein